MSPDYLRGGKPLEQMEHASQRILSALSLAEVSFASH